MKKLLLIEKRKKSKKLHKQGWSARKISRYLVASKDSINKWVKMTDEEVIQDNRGWKKGNPRKYTKQQKKRNKKQKKRVSERGKLFHGSKSCPCKLQ